MKLFVTGGAGFIGSNFIHYYLAQHPQDSVVNFDKLTYAGNLANLADLKNEHRYRFVKGDICDRRQVLQAMQGCDVVVHFAAESHVDRSITGPEVFALTNFLGTQVLLDVARELDVWRFHHISTDEVFGALPLDSQERFTEYTPYDPRSPYSASKAASDHLVRSYFHTYKLPVTISNCSNNFGPYHFPEKFIPLAITNLLEGQKVPIYGDGLYIRDWLHVTDHCRAIDLILHRGVAGQTYLVGGYGERSNKQIVELLLDYLDMDESMIVHVADRPGHDRRYAIDPSKIEQELGWQPTIELEQGLQETVDWYKKNKKWWKSIKSGEYKDYYKKIYEKRRKVVV